MKPAGSSRLAAAMTKVKQSRYGGLLVMVACIQVGAALIGYLGRP